jgi:ribosomal protein S18 acetylase RimI-like enzyme
MSDEVRVARAGAERLEALAPLYAAMHCHHRGTTWAPLVPDDAAAWAARREVYARHLAEGDGFLVVSDRDGEAVGYAFVLLNPAPDDTFSLSGAGLAEVYSLSVLPGQRGGGIGGALMDAVEAELEVRGIRDVSLAVMAENDDALRFYARRGYRSVETVLYRFGREPGR